MKRLISIVTVGLILTVFLNTAGAENEAIENAIRLAREGQTQQAISQLEIESLKDNPKEVAILIHGLLGDLYASQHEIDKAVTHYDSILKLDPHLELALFKKGLALKQQPTMESLEGAIAAFNESYRLGYNNPDVFSNIGFCYKVMIEFGLVPKPLQEQTLLAAKENFQKALELDPESSHALYHFADLEFNMGEFQESLTKYRKLLELMPNDPALLVRLGHAMFYSGDAEGALDQFDKGIKFITAQRGNQDPLEIILLQEIEVDAHLYRAEVLHALSRKDEAIKDYEAVLSLTDPEHRPGKTLKTESSRKRAEEMLQELGQDVSEKNKTVMEAAERGDASAQFSLGKIYFYGLGVSQDYAEAIKWYRKAADQGNMDAQLRLAELYATGEGVVQDYAEMAKWVRKAADQGHAAAQFNLGQMYKTGNNVSQDQEEAVKWYRKSAEQGFCEAQAMLGSLYYLGRGVPKDYIQAYKWYKLAANGLNGNAQKNASMVLELLQKIMTAQQLDEAQRLLREWNSKE